MIWNQSCFIVPQREKVMCLYVRSCHINIFKHRMLAKRSHNILKVIDDIFLTLCNENSTIFNSLRYLKCFA